VALTDLRHLVVSMHLGIAGIGARPVDRLRLDLSRREDKVHVGGLIWGRADMPSALPRVAATEAASAMWRKQKRPSGVSSGRKSPTIYRQVKGATNVNAKCESESHVS